MFIEFVERIYKNTKNGDKKMLRISGLIKFKGNLQWKRRLTVQLSVTYKCFEICPNPDNFEMHLICALLNAR